MPIKKNIIELPEILRKMDLENIRVSASSLSTFERCKAQFIIEKFMLPKLSTKETEDLSKKGSLFHKYAEDHFKDKIVKWEIENGLDADKVEDIEEYRKIVEQTDYFQEKDYLNELEIAYNVVESKEYTLQIYGFIDKLTFPTKDSVDIIDYKTSQNPDVNKDFKQLLIYALVLNKIYGYKPENIKIIIHYVANLGEKVFSVTDNDLIFTENRIISISRKIRNTIKSFQKTNSIITIPHSPSNSCTFCPICGNCAAYQSYINPDFNLDQLINEKAVQSNRTINQIINEYDSRKEVLNIVENRFKVLKRYLTALEYKAQKGQLSTGEQKDIQKLRDNFSVRQNKYKRIFKDDYLNYKVSDIINNVSKSTGLSINIDTQVMQEVLRDNLDLLVPNVLNPKSLSDKDRKKLEDKIREIPQNMFIVRKS